MSSNLTRAAVVSLFLLQVGGGCEGHGTDDTGAVLAVTLRASENDSGQEGNAKSGVESARPFTDQTEFTRQAVSADGRKVAFTSDASNLVAGDTNSVPDVFVRDTLTGTTTRASLDPAGSQFPAASGMAAVSADGRYVAFENGLGAARQIYRRNLETGVTELVTEAVSGGPAGNACYHPSLSADGRFVAYYSNAFDVRPPGELGNFAWDVLVRDMTVAPSAGGHRLASCDSMGGELGGGSWNPSISADGRWVAFQTIVGLAAGDMNGGAPLPHPLDVYVRDMQDTVTFAMTWISSSPAGLNVTRQPGFFYTAVEHPFISPDGNFVAFQTLADDVVSGDTNGVIDVFVRARTGGPTERVSVNAGGVEARTPAQTASDGSFRPSLSSDGRFVAFHSNAFNLVTGDFNQARDVFVKDRATGGVVRVSVRTFGEETLSGQGSSFGSISAEGRFVAFTSGSPNLAENDINGVDDVFLRGPLR